MVVHPRLVAAEHHDDFTRDVVPSGVPNLDRMLAGGLTRGSTTLLIGPAGVGKSTVAMQFAVTAMRSGIKVASYVFDEVLATLTHRVEKLCLGTEGGLRSFVQEGLLHAQQIDPAEMSPGAFAREVERSVDAGAKIVIIDSLNGYLNAMPEERFLTTHLHELFSYLDQKGILTLVVVAQHGLLVGSGIGGEVDVSYLADTVMMFRYFEARGEIMQAISVVKKRTGAHERTLRRMQISGRGITIGEPLRAFRGVMTGAPHFEGDPDSLRQPTAAEGDVAEGT
jgi:circadian clock protein KaiC